MKNHSRFDSLDLSAIAHQAMIDAGFVPDVPRSVLDELHSIESIAQPFPADSSARDLRALLWSSIDDSKSRDLDQVEYAESLPNGAIRLMVGIAEVDEFVQKGRESMHTLRRTAPRFTRVLRRSQCCRKNYQRT